MDETPEDVLRRFNDAFDLHDAKAMMALMTEDCVFENTFPPPDGERFTGREAVQGFWIRFFQSSPQAVMEIEESFTAGERGFQRWRYQWEEGGFVRGVDLFRFRDGKIAEKLSYVKG